ncbi:MAG TPA: excinuclease ABC subunit UvrA [Mycobacteriales bacterium]|jgi:excinuclease UvrABC ATPase subunit|nr:excinuclease ABC subunit UvrA [Mycobacteriales bacterium]
MTHDHVNSHINVVGAREHNLKDVSLRIPKRQITVVTGVSGSGKSSLVFDTIAAESGRQLSETFTTFVRNRLPRYGQPDVDTLENLSAAIVIDQKRLGGNARSTVGTVTDIYSLMRLLWSRVGTPFVGYSNAFSFNDPQGMCLHCTGLGTVRSLDVDQLVNKTRSLSEGAIRFPTFHVGGWTWRTYANSGLFDVDLPLRGYPPDLLHTLLRAPAPDSDGDPPEGIVTRFERIWLGKDASSLRGRSREAFGRVVTQERCPRCAGTRLSEAALSCRIGGRNIADCVTLEADELLEFVRTIADPTGAPIIATLTARLEQLVSIGLGYLSLARSTSTLSGGESQRVKTVRQLGSSLTDMTYIFDEPSVGLHPHDVSQLTTLLRGLRDKGNTILVVEHDPDVIAIADHIVDLGPGAGEAGGRLLYQGDLEGLARSGTSTGEQLRHRPSVNETPRPWTSAVEIRGADQHNLRDVDADIPVGVLTVVTGVAGSGKSSLIHGNLPAARPDAVTIDQGALHASRRSNPASYTGILDSIRAVFAAENSVSPSLFSPNSSGACPRCAGLGVIYTDLAFLDPVVSVCEECRGRRFTDEVLGYRYRGLDISEVFGLSISNAVDVFDEPATTRRLRRLVEVGLGYLPLGQPLTTLSGGERQRLKLADELDRPGRVYIFDEPTTGLHPSDVVTLLRLLHRLVDGGGTVVVIEHNLDMIAQADWVIDLGPGPGRYGGRLLFSGTPRDLLNEKDSPTAHYLRKLAG